MCETNPLPWDTGTPLDQRRAIVQQRIAALPANTFAPFDAGVVTEDEIDLCLGWPDVPHPAAATPPAPYPTVPTLILQGAEDLRTPPEWSARIAARIPGSKRIVIKGVGHSTIGSSECAGEAILRFARGRRPPASCPRVRTGVPAADPAPAAFASLRGYPGLPLKVGRTVRAIGATVGDVLLALSSGSIETAGGGLRGGTWEIGEGQLHLRDYEAVRGVEVSGTARRTYRLRITGSKAARGEVTLRSSGRLTGRLGGHRISLRLALPD